MTLTVVTSDDPRALVAHVADMMRAEPLGAFDDERFVIQSFGMERWIRLELAKRLGCAASLAFDFPAALARELAALTGAGAIDARFGREALTWRIDALLESRGDDPALRPLRASLADGDARTRFGVATRIAARFDDYQLYRPETLLAWERGVLAVGPSAEPGDDARAHVEWQAALWRMLCDGGEPMHLARWYAESLGRLGEAREAPTGFPRRLTVFGVSTLPELFLRMISVASRVIPVTLYVVAPPDETWDAIVPGNALVRGMTTPVRELLSSPRLRNATRVRLPSTRSHAATMLRVLQRDVQDGVDRREKLAVAADDRSLTVHVCHSELREMEVLRDQLLDAFDRDPTLRPHDVLVLVPDVARYAPFVDAVFGVTERGVPSIEYHLADRPLSQASTIARALLAMLSLGNTRVTAPDVIALLDVPAVARAASLGESGSESGSETASAFIERVAIRWGIDGAMRRDLFDLPALDANTWREGLDRLLLGVATGPVDELVGGVLPSATDTLGDLEQLGGLASWMSRLFERVVDWRRARPVGEWVDTLRDALATLFVIDGQAEARELQSLGRALADLADAASNAGHVERQVELGVVRDWLGAALDDESFGSRFLVGGMTVCALKPMRTIPFRVIAIAGLGDEAFPRRARRAAYDLLGIEGRPGDRDLRADDRQLFLDTLGAADDRLILSYVGGSMHDQKERPASIVVDELLRVVDASFENGRAHVTFEHALQPFSGRYFGEDSRLFSYSRLYADALAQSRAGSSAAAFIASSLPVSQQRDVIRLEDLIDCWTNPSRYFASRTLGVDLRDDAAVLDDVEPISLDALASYRVRDALLSAMLRGTYDAERARARWIASGILPSGAAGAVWFDRIADAVREVRERCGDGAPRHPLGVRVIGTDWELVGRIDGMRGDGRLQARAARFKATDCVRAWITHLALNASNAALTTRVVGTDRDGVLPALASDVARAHLTELIAGLRHAAGAPFPFFPAASHEYARDAKAARKPALARARDVFSGTEFSKVSPESVDPYVQLCWRNADPFADEEAFARWAKCLWSPALASAEWLGARS